MSFKEFLKELHKRLNTPNFTGLQFKVNTDPEWKETLSLRCNRMMLDQVVEVVTLSMELAKEFSGTLERISINKCYRLQETTTKKVFIPNRRTIYVTIRPPKEEFDYIQKSVETRLKDNIRFYYDVAPLIEILEEQR